MELVQGIYCIKNTINEQLYIGSSYHVFYFNGFSSKLKYVHELQNLYFALTQRELTVA